MYLQDPESGQIKFGTNSYEFNFTTTVANNIDYFQIQGSYYYMYISYNARGFSSKSNSSTRILLYKLNRSPEEPEIPEEPEDNKITHKAEIELTTLNPITHQSSKTREIKRNDFIDVHVTVNYNTVKGRIEYKVANWKEAGGDITFD